MWLLPSPARARRACPLPGQRLSIFSILRPEREKKLSIGVHGFAENRENRQPLDREEGSGKAEERKRSSHNRMFGSRKGGRKVLDIPRMRGVVVGLQNNVLTEAGRGFERRCHGKQKIEVR